MGAQKGKEVGRMHRRRRTGTFGCPEGKEVGGMCWFAEEGDRKRKGERCVYVNRRVRVVEMEERGEICRRKERVTTTILLSEPRFSPDGSLIVVGSDDACVDIYTTQGLSRVGYCRGIPSFVTHLDWSQDGKYLQVCVMCIEEGPVSCL